MARLLEQRKQFTKNAIYEAALAILREDGFDSLTMERVAEKAGVAKGSVYNYFSNKVELVRFVFHNSIDPLMGAVRSVQERDIASLEKLRDMLRTWFGYVDRHRGIINVLFSEQAIDKVLNSLDPPPRDVPVQLFASVIEQGVAEGVFRNVPATKIATMLFVMGCDTCEQHATGQEAWAVDESVEFIMDFFLHGVGKE